jgi:cyclopropane fatty-acyl-phospholipid synthase-like methyltransferase/glycosyltransferase involved in cell wall biosynthesis
MCNVWCLEFSELVLPYIGHEEKTLEVGSRDVNGSTRQIFAPRSTTYVGVDLFNGPGVDRIIDVKDLTKNFAPGSFDIVTSTEMLEHCADWQDALFQMASVLHQDGLLMITTRSPGFELHDYPADYWRFSLQDFEEIFSPIGDILELKSDMTLGWPCGVGVLLRRKADDQQLETWYRTIRQRTTFSMLDQAGNNAVERIIFDQYSRYKACSELLHKTGFDPGSTVLDIGSGPECLFGQFMTDAVMTYVDPLIPTGSDHGRITGSVFTNELDEKYFDCVSAVDVFEHVPPEHRLAFLERCSSLSKKVLILGFPTSDSSDAAQTDKAIDEQYRAIFGHDYSWLEEHYKFGLPSLEETKKQLGELGWHVQSVGHGHAPWLKELLGFVICIWDIPALHDVVLKISEKFNRELYPFDFRPPFYRQFLIATREPVPALSAPALPDAIPAPDDLFKELMEQAHNLYLATSIRQFDGLNKAMEKQDATIVDLNEKIQEVSVWGAGLNAALVERDATIFQLNTQIAEVSQWASTLNVSLSERDSVIAELSDQINEVSASANILSSFATQCSQEAAGSVGAMSLSLAEKHAELMRLSDWADSMRRELEQRNASIFYKAGAGLRGLKKSIRRRLSSSVVGDLIRHVRDRRRYRHTKVTFDEVRASLHANGGKLIITFPIITWDFRWQRPQHIVTRLRNQGHAILYVAMSVAALGRKCRSQTEAGTLLAFNQLDRDIQQVWLHSAGNINVYNDSIAGDDLHNLACGLGAAIAALKPTSIHYLIQFPGWWPVAERLRGQHGGKVIFDCMDDHAGFSTNSAQALQTEEHLIRQADLVITSSKLLEEKVHVLNPRTIQVKNGTEFEHFHAPRHNGELDHLSGHPIIGYYGAISDWFDMQIVAHCATAHPDWHFVLIGATFGADLMPVKDLANVHFLGEKKYAELPGYLAYFDVCTIPFKVIPLTLATNPVKFYEYMSAGKPVVSVALPELLPYRDDCYLADDAYQFDLLLQQALAEKDNPHKIERRQQLARENSWDSRAEAIVAAMRNL